MFMPTKDYLLTSLTEPDRKTLFWENKLKEKKEKNIKTKSNLIRILIRNFLLNLKKINLMTWN